jgi:antitoxin HicB
MTKRRRQRTPAAAAQPGDEETAGSNPERVQQSPKEYLNLPYQIALRADERNGGWTAQVEEFPGCEAHGDNPEQATKNLRGAMERWVSEALERGENIPEPRALSGHSGRLLLRMPQSLHAQLAHSAEGEGISLNQFITTALASAVGWRDHSGPDTRRRGSNGSDAKPATAADVGTGRESKRRSVLLAANLIMLIVLAALAVVLLINAWNQS